MLPTDRRTTNKLWRKHYLRQGGNEGGDWAESQAHACALNFTLIGMYKENLSEIVFTQGLIHSDLFVLSSFPDIGILVLVRNPCKS